MKHLAAALLFLLFSSFIKAQPAPRWTREQANTWYAAQAWPRGCNFIPSNAINQLEMWQAETFDSATIDKELNLAEGIGFNTVRVFLHHVVWEIDSTAFKKRINTYLNIANKHHIKTIFVFFDDCWNATYAAGKQPEPKPGIHNSGWVRDPGRLIYKNRNALEPVLQRYVTDILCSFKNDSRILLWDLYNEPGNSGNGPRSLPLLKKVFTWARTVQPSQPLTAGVYLKLFAGLSRFQLQHSDIITYHNYGTRTNHAARIRQLKKQGRPLICTEYMARTFGSNFESILPLLKEEQVGAVNWGLVSGKTNTKYAWFKPMPSGAEPSVWFHDIFKPDGTPYRTEEVELLKKLCGE